MNDAGEVGKDIVLGVLKAHGVEIYPQKPDGVPGMTVLAKGETLEAMRIPEVFVRKNLHRLCRVFDIPIFHFYNPHLVNKPKD